MRWSFPALHSDDRLNAGGEVPHEGKVISFKKSFAYKNLKLFLHNCYSVCRKRRATRISYFGILEVPWSGLAEAIIIEV
jgi:hypothetical protein